MNWTGGAALLVLTLVVALPGQAGGAAPAVRMVGVVDFYAQSPLGAYSGLVPERFAADDLSDLLAHAADGRFAVIPRATIGQAEATLRWQNADVLHFDRLRTLARAVGADSLVVGWIPLLVIHGGGGMPMPRDHDGNGAGPSSADANLVVQVFDAAQGRLVAETRPSASVIGMTRVLLAERVVHEALEPAVPPLLSALTSPAP